LGCEGVIDLVRSFDLIADTIAELRNRIDELDRRIAALESALGKAQLPKRVKGKHGRTKR